MVAWVLGVFLALTLAPSVAMLCIATVLRMFHVPRKQVRAYLLAAAKRSTEPSPAERLVRAATTRLAGRSDSERPPDAQRADGLSG